jgi:hypothetical protein
MPELEIQRLNFGGIFTTTPPVKQIDGRSSTLDISNVDSKISTHERGHLQSSRLTGLFHHSEFRRSTG